MTKHQQAFLGHFPRKNTCFSTRSTQPAQIWKSRTKINKRIFLEKKQNSKHIKLSLRFKASISKKTNIARNHVFLRRKHVPTHKHAKPSTCWSQTLKCKNHVFLRARAYGEKPAPEKNEVSLECLVLKEGFRSQESRRSTMLSAAPAAPAKSPAAAPRASTPWASTLVSRADSSAGSTSLLLGQS